MPPRLRNPRPTDAEPAAAARAAIRQAHADPGYDLSTEAWIPVSAGGTVRPVGLRELFTDAHHIQDVAVPHPLLRFGLRRLLEAMTVDLIRHSEDDDDAWRHRLRDSSGFGQDEVDDLLDRHAEHLWLWHPRTPFLQDARLAELLGQPQDDLPIQDLVLHLPSGSSAAWWVKAQEPALQGGLPPDQAALWAAARWFYAAHGNCAAVRLPSGATVRSQSGGSFAETVAIITQVFRVDHSSLFGSLMGGLPASLLPLGDGPGCAWLDRDQPRAVDDPLYLATLNTAGVLYTGRDGASVTRFVRGSAPLPGDTTKTLRNAAMDADRHRVGVVDAKGVTRTVRVPPGALAGELLGEFHRAGFDSSMLVGVARSGACWLSSATRRHDRLDILLVSKGGTGSSPVWEDMAGAELPARWVDPDDPDAVQVEAAVRVAFDPQDGVRRRLELACLDLFAQPGDGQWRSPRRDSPAGRGAHALAATAYQGWQLQTAAALSAVLDAPEATDPETWRQQVWQAARQAFDAVAAPFLASTRYAPRYAAARQRLTPRRPA